MAIRFELVQHFGATLYMTVLNGLSIDIVASVVYWSQRSLHRPSRRVERVMPNSHLQPDTTRRSCLRRVWRCELDDCSERVETSNVLSAAVLSCRGNPIHIATQTRQFFFAFLIPRGDFFLECTMHSQYYILYSIRYRKFLRMNSEDMAERVRPWPRERRL